ncbi:MAG: alpha/beta hydrolase [Armatimonadota bacterium]
MFRDFAMHVSLLPGIILFCCAAAQAQPPAGEYNWLTEAVDAPGVEQRTFDSAAAGGAVSYHVYLPDEYETEPERRFPVLYWLHGGGGFSGRGIRTISGHFGDAMRAGQIPPMLVVFPHAPAGSLWANSSDGSMPLETIFVEELLPHIDGTLRTIASREGRIVEGWSMGGYGAARFGLKRHDLFCAASSMSGGPLQQEFTSAPRASEARRLRVLHMVCGGEHEYFRELSPWRLAEENAEAVRENLRFRVVIGAEDEMIEVAHEFHAHLEELEIPHTFTVVPGAGHEPMRVLSALGEQGWAFYREALLATTTDVPAD